MTFRVHTLLLSNKSLDERGPTFRTELFKLSGKSAKLPPNVEMWQIH